MPSLMQPELQATNEPGGTPLINGTPTLASWTTPNDGHMHTVLVTALKVVTSNETGGVVQLNVGGANNSVTLIAAAQTVGTYVSQGAVVLVPPNTLVSVVQGALTAGASVVTVDLWGTP